MLQSKRILSISSHGIYQSPTPPWVCFNDLSLEQLGARTLLGAKGIATSKKNATDTISKGSGSATMCTSETPPRWVSEQMYQDSRTAFLRVKGALAPFASCHFANRQLYHLINPEPDFILRPQRLIHLLVSPFPPIGHHVLLLLFQPKVCSQGFSSTSTTWVSLHQQGCCGSGPATFVMTNLCVSCQCQCSSSIY